MLTTLESTEVNACWAPMTSLLSRETRAPVWARVKNAIGWRMTWAKTWVRRSTMRPSPIRDDSQRDTRVTPALTTAMSGDEEREPDDEARSPWGRCRRR